MATAAKGKKRGASPKAQKQTGISGWVWLGTGLLIGLFVAFLVFLQSQPAKTIDQVGKKVIPEVVEKAMNYDFYKILPKLEVVLPEISSSEGGVSKKIAPVVKDGIYVLQAGSFKKHEDADRQKASLALLGVESKIVKVEVGQGEIWHRVQIGPFTELEALNETRSLLIENEFDTLLLRVRG